MTMASSEDDLDPKELLVDVLKSAIATGLLKDAPAPKVDLGKWWRPGEAAVEKEARTVSAALRREKRRRCAEAETRIAELQSSGTRWWLKPEATPSRRDWFDMPPSERTNDLKRDLEVLSMRGAFNPKKHYKNLDGLTDAKWVQIGTVMDHPLDGNRGRLPNALRKRTLAQQWRVDPEMGGALERSDARHQDAEQRTARLRARQYPLMRRRNNRRRRT